LALPLGGRGRAPYVVMAGLLVVIVASVALTVWALFGGPRAAPSRQVEVVRALYFKCARCGHEFEMTPKEFDDFLTALRARDRASASLVHCPKCGGRHSCAIMTRCPQCGKRYVPYGVENAVKMARGEPTPAGTADVCPHCKTDIAEYWRRRSRR
jgi:hypothetical protein